MRRDIIKQNIQRHKTEAYFYDATHPENFSIFEQRRLRREMGKLASEIDLAKPVLDLGSGTGHMVRHLQRFGVEPTACDLSPEMLEENPAKRKVLCDVADMPFDDGYFGAVVSYSVFHHFVDPEAVLKEAIRVSGEAAVMYLDHDFDLMERKGRLGHYSFTLVDVFGWLLWLVANPKQVKRLVEYALWGRKRHLANIALLGVSEYPKGVDKGRMMGILRDAGFMVKLVDYGSGKYLKAYRWQR